jgi:hypothetical protein
MIRRGSIHGGFLAAIALGATLLFGPSTASAAEECSAQPRVACFGIASLSASLSDTQAGAHPDLTFSFAAAEDPETKANLFGLKDTYAATKNVRIELPPGLIGNPNVVGATQQCKVEQLVDFINQGCPNGSQVGLSQIYAYQLLSTYQEPVFMMQPPGGDIVARLGLIAGIFPIFIDFKLRSESDYGITAEISNSPAAVRLIKSETTTWGVPADPSHDTQRCTPNEVFVSGCVASPPRPPGSRALAFLTNPTTCGVPLGLRVGASSWIEPDRFGTDEASFPEITGCDKLPFGPSLEIEPTSHVAASPTGAVVRIKQSGADGVEVLEPSQMRSVEVKLPEGFAFNPSAADGLATCSAQQVHLGENAATQCPDASKIADAEFDIPVLERKLRGALYLRDPRPGRPFGLWIVADDLGLHVKLTGELEVDRQSGQIEELTSEIPQAPIRETKIEIKSGSRAPLVTPQRCGEYRTAYAFVPWSGGPPVEGTAPMQISEGCDTGGFNPKLSAGTTDRSAGKHSPFVFTLTREDGEQNPASLDITLPKGLAATFAGIPRCEGADAVSGNCPAASHIGHVDAAVGAGSAPLWVPQAGKRPAAVYLGGPYRGAPFGIVAVVPKQAGPFDFGDEVVRSAIYVDPLTAQATAKADPLPQLIEGIPIGYRALHVDLDHPNFTLNPTSCAQKSTDATVTSAQGAIAHPSAPFAAFNCAELGFKPRLSLKLRGGTRRGNHPSLRAVIRPRTGDANIGGFSITLPHSEFLDQAHIRTVCTRVQFAGHQCPEGSIYGSVMAKTPLFDFPLEGSLYLRSSSNPLPDMVAVLKGPASMPIEVNSVGRIDSVNGGIRTTFQAVPDAPLNEIVATLPGASKGLLVNSTNLCLKANRATAKFAGQNEKTATLHPALQTSCKAARRRKR